MDNLLSFFRLVFQKRVQQQKLPLRGKDTRRFKISEIIIVAVAGAARAVDMRVNARENTAQVAHIRAAAAPMIGQDRFFRRGHFAHDLNRQLGEVRIVDQRRIAQIVFHVNACTHRDCAAGKRAIDFPVRIRHCRRRLV